MASGRMAPSNAKSGRNVDPTLSPDSRLAFRRQVRQTHGTQGIIFADADAPTSFHADGVPPHIPQETTPVPLLLVVYVADPAAVPYLGV